MRKRCNIQEVAAVMLLALFSLSAKATPRQSELHQQAQHKALLEQLMPAVTGVGTAGKGYYANQLLGAGNAYMTSQIEGQDSTASVVGSMAGTGVGYNAGAAIKNKLESQYIKNQLGMYACKYSLEYSEKAIGPGYIYQGGKMSFAPGIIGGGVGNGLSEASGNAVQPKLKRGEIETSSFETPFITFMYASSYKYNIGFISHDSHCLACCSWRS